MCPVEMIPQSSLAAYSTGQPLLEIKHLQLKMWLRTFSLKKMPVKPASWGPVFIVVH